MATKQSAAVTASTPRPTTPPHHPTTPCACRLDSYSESALREVTLCPDHVGLSELLVAVHGAGLEGHSVVVTTPRPR